LKWANREEKAGRLAFQRPLPRAHRLFIERTLNACCGLKLVRLIRF
jgi:hypothetical protein